MFHQLTRKQLGGIVEIQLRNLKTRLADRGLSLTISNEALTALCDEGYDPQFGARPLKRVIQHKLENPIATGILQGDYEAGDTIEVGYSGNELVFTKVNGTPCKAL